MAKARLDAELGAYTTNPLTEVTDDWKALRQSAAIAGFRDSRQLESINELLDDLLPFLNEAGERRSPRGGRHS